MRGNESRLRRCFEVAEVPSAVETHTPLMSYIARTAVGDNAVVWLNLVEAINLKVVPILGTDRERQQKQ